MIDDVIFRYLKFRSKRGFIRGTSICKHLRLPLHRLYDLDDMNGIGSFGPASVKKPVRIAQWFRYARSNGYMADFRGFFRLGDRIYCLKNRPVMRGNDRPRRYAQGNY